MTETTETPTKPELKVIAIKTKLCESILGYYVGDMEMSFSKEPAIVLLRPVKIDIVYTPSPTGLLTKYIPSLYFPFGDNAFPIPLSGISHQSMANEFFSKLYKAVVVELVVSEDARQNEISKAIDLKVCENLISQNSFIVYSNTHYTQ